MGASAPNATRLRPSGSLAARIPNGYAKAKTEGRVKDLPVNHNPDFLTLPHPTLETGVEARREDRGSGPAARCVGSDDLQLEVEVWRARGVRGPAAEGV